ncbi:MAG TPA: DUF262 domain-containing HNH endonuclease family protein [Rhizomicrobium sp.]|nr:DUF262 domain-containing HNH endonuclease family protein [Rhizomicrobium sp.]
MAEIQSATVSVGNLFSHDSFFRIPPYQRPFSWDDEHFDDLIIDIKDTDRNTQYFLGTMVLHKEAGGTKVVVDGQQRLTSLLILLACLRDAIDDPQYKSGIQDKIMQQKRVIDGIPERVRLEVKDAATFQTLVVEDGGTKKDYDLKGLTEPRRRYVFAAKIFHKRIEDLTQAQKQELVTFVTQRCVLIYLLADSFEQAFKLFEIVNDRGKQLRRIDILKSINIAPDVIGQDTVRDRVAQRWEALEDEVGEVNFESVFFLIRLILLKDKPKGDLLKEFEGRIFGKKVQKGEPFAELVFDYVKLYREIFIDKIYIASDDKYHIRYQSLIHIMDMEFQASEWRACALFFAKKFGRDHFYQFCLAIEKLFLTQWVEAIRKDERYDSYSKVLEMIEAEKDPAKVIASIGFDDNAILNAVAGDDLYHRGFCKYALLRLELLSTEHDVAKRFEAKSIEHVFPQNPEAGSPWLKGVAPADIPKFVNQAGNLVLISKSRNSAASNLPFDVKKEKYLKPRVSDYPRSMQVVGYPDWTPEVIQKRTEEVRKIFLNDI